MKKFDLDSGYREAYLFTKSHYENFPVISFLIPKELQKHISVLYWFARTADDISDEGNHSPETRLSNLAGFEAGLNELLDGKYASDRDYALANTIKTKNLSPGHFFNILKAFRQDVLKKRYRDFKEVLEYCNNSANPVGRLVLELMDIRNEEACFYSDKICTALQITNFIQDTRRDYEKGRIYYPLDEMEKFGVNEKMFELKENNLNFNQLVEFSIDRTKKMFSEGKKLLKHLSGRIRYEMNWTIKGGEMILYKIEKNNFDVLNCRPVLTKADYFILLFKSFFSDD